MRRAVARQLLNLGVWAVSKRSAGGELADIAADFAEECQGGLD